MYIGDQDRDRGQETDVGRRKTDGEDMYVCIYIYIHIRRRLDQLMFCATRGTTSAFFRCLGFCIGRDPSSLRAIPPFPVCWRQTTNGGWRMADAWMPDAVPTRMAVGWVGRGTLPRKGCVCSIWAMATTVFSPPHAAHEWIDVRKRGPTDWWNRQNYIHSHLGAGVQRPPK